MDPNVKGFNCERAQDILSRKPQNSLSSFYEVPSFNDLKQWLMCQHAMKDLCLWACPG